MIAGYWVIEVKVTPKAKENKIVSWDGEVLKVRVTEVPEKGKANHAVIRLLAEAFSLPQRELTLISGSSSKNKRILLPESCKEQLHLFM